MLDIIGSDIQTIIKSPWIDWTLFDGKTIYISGISGQIGKYLLALFSSLRKKGIIVKVIGLCRNANKLKEFCTKHDISLEREDINIVEHDVKDYLSIPEKIDYYFVAASPTSPKFYQDTPVDVFETNLFGAMNVFKAVAEKSESARIIILSSSTVYGNFEEGKTIDENTFGSFHPLDIRASYGESKRAVETLAMSYITQYGLDVRIARIRRVYGPTVNLHDSLFGKLLNGAAMGGEIALYKGHEMIQPIYISDVISGIMTILLNPKGLGIAYNLCGSEVLSMDNLAVLIQEKSDGKLTIDYVDRDRINDHIRTANKRNVNNGIMKNDWLSMSGWKCQIDLDNGISRTIQSIREDFQ